MTLINHSLLSPFSIQLAIDGSDNAVDAALLVRSLPLPGGSRVAVVGVSDPGQSQSPYEATLGAILDDIQQTNSDGGIEATYWMWRGHTAKTLIEFADEHQPDLIVVGVRGLSATLKMLMGGIAQQIVEDACWPVLVVRHPFNGIQRVLLAVDGSPYSRRAAAYVAKFPLPAHAEVSVIHVLPASNDLNLISPNLRFGGQWAPSAPPLVETQLVEQQREMEERQGQAILRDVRRILETAKIKSHGVLIRGDPANEILNYVLAHEIDLVVAGSRGFSAIKEWGLGSISRKLVHYAACSVLFVRGEPR